MTHKDIALNERIIFALDVSDEAQAREWVTRLEGPIRFFKVGLELFLGAGFPFVDWLTERGHKVMLDLKFYDVPVTVQRAVAQLHGRKITFATVHGGNDSICRGAVAANADAGLLAVTVLTSFNQDDMAEMGATAAIEDIVRSRAKRAVELGFTGVVASGREAAMLRKELGPDAMIVTPGIRPKDSAIPGDDQKRSLTAGEAIGLGADYVVVGRPIRTAADPVAMAMRMQEEIAAALKA